MPHSIYLLASCEKTAEPVWLPWQSKLVFSQMFLNGNINHICQNREHLYRNQIYHSSKRVASYFCLYFVFFWTKYFPGWQVLERTLSNGSFLSYKGYLTESGGKDEDIYYSWVYDLGEQALEMIINWLFKMSLKRGVQEVIICGDCEYAKGREIFETQ